MSITPGPNTGSTGQNPTSSAAANKPQKKKNFLSFLCCMAPDDANTLDPGEATPPNKVAKAPGGRSTTVSRPDHSAINQTNNATAQPDKEKAALQNEEPSKERNETPSLDSGRTLQLGAALPANGDLNRPVDTRDAPLPELPKEAESSSAAQTTQHNPSIAVQSPARTEPGSAVPQDSSDQKDGGGDILMQDSEPVPITKDESSVTVPRGDEIAKPVLPPPPPVPQPGPSEEPGNELEQKQQWLLPPIAPRFQGKKCLVLDLDETLVHSSFKVIQVSHVED